MNTVTIDVNLANAVLNYLATRPYNEVAGLIAEFQKQAQGSQPTEPEPVAE